MRTPALLIGFGLCSTAALAQPLTSAFTYQGELTTSGTPAAGLHDLRFRLYTAGGSQVGPTLCSDNVSVVNGRFSLSLDFGPVFDGTRRFLGIEARPDTGLDCTNATGLVVLSPRQELSATPHAAYAVAAATATNATQLNGQSGSFYQNAANLSAGTIPSARLGGTYGATLALTNPGNTFVGSGGGLVDLNASNLATGTIPNARLAVPLALGGAVDWSGVILGANSSASGYGVLGSSLSASGETYGTGGLSSSTSGTGVLGIASATSGATQGVKGVSSSPTGRGVLGVSDATSGFSVGVQGESSPGNPTGTGVVGKAQATGGWFEATGASGTGLYGVASNTSGGSTDGVQGRSAGQFGVGVRGLATHGSGTTYGGRFESQSTAGVGVIGHAAAASGETEGVFGRTDSSEGRGVYGLATATTGTTYGGRFETSSSSGLGVFGLATAGSGNTFGVQGGSDSTAGRGVYGYASATTGATVGGLFTSRSTSGKAVYGWATAETGSTYGVVGARSSIVGLGYAVFAEGDLGASGFKSFRIDHPADPRNKYLLHYSAESPEVINFYSGKAALDERGEATIELPGYFASINRDPRYTLTAIGAPMPMLHVAEEIDEASLDRGARGEPGESVPRCSFRIAGGAPGARVSWRVEALRNDRWVRARGAPVEVDKQGIERGTYQHPVLFGPTGERGVNPAREPARHPLPPDSRRGED